MTQPDRPRPASCSRGRQVVAVPVLTLLLGGLLIAGACDDNPVGTDQAAPEGTVEIRASIQSPSVSTLVVEVTGPGIPDPQMFNLELVGHDTDGDGVEDQFTAEGFLRVPAGGNRTFDVRAFDEVGIRTHEGSSTMHVTPGKNATAVVVSLIPLTGNQPIAIVLGSFDITVMPETVKVREDSTQQFTAEVADENGMVDGASVIWATSNPGVATVEADGIATANAPGTASIVATWMGVGAAGELVVPAPAEPRDDK